MVWKVQTAICVVLLALSANYFLKNSWFMSGIVTTPSPEYDYIIVGGGTAGCVLARRLWERTNSSVLVIESGHTPPWISSVPLLAPLMQGYADWSYKTVPQENSQHGMRDRKSSWPRGKVLGGSSILNYMLHMWGTRADFDELWSSVSPDWNFKAVLKYFRRVENFHGRNVSDLRGTGGPLHVEEFKEDPHLVDAFLEGAQSLGIQKGDLNGELEDGAMLTQSNIENGMRMSAFGAYLVPVSDMSNIHLLTNTAVFELIIKNNTAVGVKASNLLSSENHQVMARKEIILSAGVVGSPKLLMMSGIGPKSQLEKHKIRVVKDLPGVGQKLRDHLNVPMYFHLDVPVSTTATKLKSPNEICRYITRGKGRLSHSGIEAIVRLADKSNSTTNKMFFMLFNMGSVNEQLFSSISNFRRDIFRRTFPDTQNNSKEGFIILASCSHPVSTGNIRLKSRYSLDPPLIDPKYLSNPEDVKCLIKAMKMAAKLGMTKAMRKLGARLHLPHYPACAEFTTSLQSDRYLECWLRISGMTAFHPVGTCAMGSDKDPMSVLDSEMRVRDIKNLRVVDSSSFPFPTAGNPHAVVLMLAEKAVDLIVKTSKYIIH